MKPESLPTNGHIPGLDALRAIAVLLVSFQHWQPEAIGHVLLFGSTGVSCFFVLSGFLITAILLKQHGAPFWPALMNFHWRRALRIYPAYYALNIALLAAGIPLAWDTAVWNLTYTTNLHVFATGAWIGNVSHFWSLAVEFQFYLFWPFVILLTPRRWLVPALSAIIVLSCVTRLVLFATGFDDSQIKVFTLSCFDYFACGGLLALPSVRARLWSHRSTGNMVAWGCVGLFVAAGIFAECGMMSKTAAISVQLPMLLVFITQLIFLTTSSGHQTLWKKWLDTAPLRYLGLISYGFYLYHNLAGSFWKIVFGKLHMEEPGGLTRLALYFVWTLVVSALSYHCFEVFFLRFKSFKRKRPQAANTTAAQPSPSLP